jgi:hypothetical protein
MIKTGHASTSSTSSKKTPLVQRTLRPRQTAELKASSTKKQNATGRRWKKSWIGLEEQREALRAVAREVRESDAIVRGLMESVLATGAICQAIRDPSTASCPQVARAAEAQRQLRDMHGHLVWESHLDWFFVRQEWQGILDPRVAEEATLCTTVAEGLNH